jgi:hypothetical protein
VLINTLEFTLALVQGVSTCSVQYGHKSRQVGLRRVVSVSVMAETEETGFGRPLMRLMHFVNETVSFALRGFV